MCLYVKKDILPLYLGKFLNLCLISWFCSFLNVEENQDDREIELQVMNESEADNGEENKPLREIEDTDQNTESTQKENLEHKNKETETPKEGCCSRMFSRFLILGRGWGIYMSYDVAFAGLGLACLFLTVLGFDSITVGK